MKTNISTAPKGIYDNYLTRFYGNSSMAAGALDATQYAFICHYDVDEPTPFFTALAERLKDDFRVYRLFINAHADEIRAEGKLLQIWRDNREWAQGPSAQEINAKNAAAAAADVLEAQINARAEELLLTREQERAAAARAKAYSDARQELGGNR